MPQWNDNDIEAAANTVTQRYSLLARRLGELAPCRVDEFEFELSLPELLDLAQKESRKRQAILNEVEEALAILGGLERQLSSRAAYERLAADLLGSIRASQDKCRPALEVLTRTVQEDAARVKRLVALCAQREELDK